MPESLSNPLQFSKPTYASVFYTIHVKVVPKNSLREAYRVST